MTPDRTELLNRIAARFAGAARLSYARTLQEVFGPEGEFLGDNVFETTFEREGDDVPLIYEVSGPYDAASRNYATIGRVYRAGRLLWSGDIKPGILARTAAMVCLALGAVNHTPRRVLLVGPGKLGAETLSWLIERQPELREIALRGRSAVPAALVSDLAARGLTVRVDSGDGFAGYDCVILTTDTDTILVDAGRLATLDPGAVMISTCTTSLVGEIAPELYGAAGICTVLDHDLTRRLTPDMRRADDGGALSGAIMLAALLSGRAARPANARATLIRLTGTPMQNLAVIDMLREAPAPGAPEISP